MSVLDLPSGAHIEYVDTGSGTVVVYLQSEDEVPPDAPFLRALAQRFRVLVPSLAQHEGAEVMAEFIHTIVGGPVHVIAESKGGAPGCWLAILHPELVSSLVLVTPHGDADLHARLSEIAAPTLVLWGTADEVAPPESGQVYSRQIPNSYRMFIYGAAHPLPLTACGQFVSLTTDFIERGDRFVVAQPGGSE